MSFTLLGILQSQAAAAGGAGEYDLLETVELTTTTTVSFTGLDSYTDYKHLQLRFTSGKANGSGSNPTMYLRFNGDSGANYAWHNIGGNGSSVTGDGAYSGQTYLRLNDAIGGDSANGIFSAAVVDILDFSSTTKNTTLRALHGCVNASEKDIFLTSGLWNSTSAVTSIEQYVSDQSAGSRFSLYGIKGA